MNSSEEQKGPGAPGPGSTPSGGAPPSGEPAVDALPPDPKPLDAASDGGGVSSEHEDGHPHEPETIAPVSSVPPVVTPPVSTSATEPSPGAMVRSPGNAGGGKTPPPPSGGDGDDGDEEDGYMLRMSFLEHLE